MFLDNLVTNKEYLASDEEQLQAHHLFIEIVRYLGSKIKRILFSPSCVSGMHFYLDPDDES